MIFVYLHFAVAILDFVMLFLIASKSTHIFKTKYPDWVIPKSHWADSTLTWIKTILAFSCPLFNIVCLWVCISKEVEICENVVNKMWLKCLEEANKNDSPSCDIPSP